MSKDRLFLIQSNFDDPNIPGTKFFCPYCNVIEGLLATNPQFADNIEIIRVPFLRPRQAVIEAIGAENQGLPVLILGRDPGSVPDAKEYQDLRFINDTKRILELLATRHGFPVSH